MTRNKLMIAVIVLTAAAFVAEAPAQSTTAQPVPPTGAAPPAYDLKENYTKYEYRIPMRDGKRLFASAYIPKDTTKTYPFLLQRTPYSCAPYGVDQYPTRPSPNEEFAKAGYIFVCQDVRGRYLSEGTFVEMSPHKAVKKSKADVDESTDMYDSVEWLVKNVPNNNGKLGIWGISYPGFYTSASIIDSHPAIKAASPQAPIADFYMRDDVYHGGAYMLPHNYGFFTFFKPQENPTVEPKRPMPFDFHTKDAYDYFLKLGNLSNIAKSFGKERQPYFEDQINHDTYDEYWKARAIPPHLKNIKAAVLTVGGWFDAEDLQGALSTYRAIEDQNPGISNAIVMGPWVHGGWLRSIGKSLGHVDFAMKNSEFFQKKIMLPFFEQHLKAGADAKLPEAYMFESGTNVWRQYSSWPPANAKEKTLYFHEDGKLDWKAPSASQSSFDQYVSDPNRPVPYIGYTAIRMPQEYMVSDQRFASTRPDVLVYQTDVLDEDVTIAGPISPKLFVSTTGTDADWVVKLIDVYPSELGEDPPFNRNAAPRDVEPPKTEMAGYQQLVRGDPLRARYRNSFEKPEPLTPGKIESIKFDIPDAHHTFRRGHRIMVHVQSSWFPLFDRNPQTYVRIKDAKPEDFKVATQKVYRWRDQASGVGLRVIDGAGK